MNLMKSKSMLSALMISALASEGMLNNNHLSMSEVNHRRIDAVADTPRDFEYQAEKKSKAWHKKRNSVRVDANNMTYIYSIIIITVILWGFIYGILKLRGGDGGLNKCHS